MFPITRRHFVAGTASAGALAALGDFNFLGSLPRLTGAVAPSLPGIARFSPDIEPLVKLIEETPRPALINKIAAEVHKGTSYQELLAATFLAGVRGIQPRPVGYKFHAVMVINSAYQATLAAPDSDRWLPLFWCIDNFKASQARNRVEGDWRLPAVAEARLPAPHQAKARFIEAMDNWDEEGTDRAIVPLVRNAGAAEVYELFWRFGARDFRDIGHKAIYAANSFRTLQAIGWRHAEPVVRSLAYAMLMYRGTNPAKRDDPVDRPGRDNIKRARALVKLPRGGTRSPAASLDLLSALRTATADEASAKVAAMLTKGIHPDSLWDGVFLRCGELLMQQPGIGGLHTVTTANALRFAYDTTASEETRHYVLLQAAAFLPLFKEFMAGRERLRDLKLDKLEKAEVKGSLPEALESIFADVSGNPMRAAQKVLGLLEGDRQRVGAFMTAARRLIFSKGRDSHDYKFSSAALEDYFHVAPEHRTRFAASSVFWLKGSGAPDNGLIRRTRTALAKG
jgi:hypothetical protein